MSEGELLQIEKARKLDIDEETYFRIISDKTASLLAACTMSGAASATEDEHIRERMKAFGQALGMAFQIRDDLFDFGVTDVGKPLGIDLIEKKMTLPLIYSLSRCKKADRKRLMRLVRKDQKSKEDIRTVTQFVTEQGGIEYATSAMMEYANEAKQELEILPPSPARDALSDLVTFTVTRQK